MPSEKIDLHKLRKDEYATPKEPRLVDVKAARYLAVAGQGEPGGDAFREKVQAIYGVAYAVKMAKKKTGLDYGVSKLEGLWWGASGKPDFAQEPQNTWNWKLLILAPDFVTEADLDAARSTLLKKGKDPAVNEVHLETIKEGRCVQMLHVGPYDTEHETIARMKSFAENQGLSFHGLHHEIYLSDPRRVPPERLQTIIRVPVR